MAPRSGPTATAADLRMLRAADTGVNVGRLGRLGRLRDFKGLDETGPLGLVG